MSADAVGWVFRHSPATNAALLIHLALADSANDMNNYELWMRQAWLADKTRVSRQTVNSTLTWLIDEGLLVELENRKIQGLPNRYRLLMPDLPALFDTRTGGVKNADTPYQSGTTGQGVSNIPTGGVKYPDTGVSNIPTQNSSNNSRELNPPLPPPTIAQALVAVGATTVGGEARSVPKASAFGRDSARYMAQKIKARRRSLLNLTQLAQTTAQLLEAGWSEDEIMAAEPKVIDLTSLRGWDIELGRLPKLTKPPAPRVVCPNCTSGWVLDASGEPASRCSTCLP